MDINNPPAKSRNKIGIEKSHIPQRKDNFGIPIGQSPVDRLIIFAPPRKGFVIQFLNGNIILRRVFCSAGPPTICEQSHDFYILKTARLESLNHGGKIAPSARCKYYCVYDVYTIFQ